MWAKKYDDLVATGNRPPSKEEKKKSRTICGAESAMHSKQGRGRHGMMGWIMTDSSEVQEGRLRTGTGPHGQEASSGVIFPVLVPRTWTPKLRLWPEAHTTTVPQQHTPRALALQADLFS